MIYLDNAATTLYKPAEVELAMVDALRNCANAGRGGHSGAMASAERIFEVRENAAELFGIDDPESVVFTLNATHALNVAIKGIMKGGGHCVVSGYEHNSVIRPLQGMRDQGVTFTIAKSPLFEPEFAIKAFSDALTSDTKCVVCTHVSNVFGYILPIFELDTLCYEKGLPLIIDASQSAGTIRLLLNELKATAFICAPGHKGLYGPQGTGLLLCRNGSEICPLLEGGTGSLSSDINQPEFLPDRHESGTHNSPGIAGLGAGIRYVLSEGFDKILEHEKNLISQAAELLKDIDDINIYVSSDRALQAGVLSFSIDGINSEEIAYSLSQNDIAVRSGLHCSPVAHNTAGTKSGTVRISVSSFNKPDDINAFIKAVSMCV